ncbi:hypothetical protein [Salinimicrobium xinjiangense]|uniref:hypothetical protein n=1 Tax=Salinimicrobium xinjiangense TaxID=438596 RepID=UPI000402974F|nr:hypothetical protein [Salinimicrobium xinjiangense]
MANPPTELKKNLQEALSGLEHLLTRTKLSVKEKLNLLEPLKILPFMVMGMNILYLFRDGSWRKRRFRIR